jgi:hypothetical protein
MRSFATILPGRDGSGSSAAFVLHLQSLAGQPHPAHMRPALVE